MKILLTGGGTGGHIMPIIAIAQELKKQTQQKNKNLELLWVGEKKSQEESAAKKYHLEFKTILCGKFRRYFSIRNFFDIITIPIGYLQAKRILNKFKPDAIFSKGGYVSAPIIFAARNLKIPIFLHESDSIPGKANLYFAKYAKKVFITFPQSAKFFANYQNKTCAVGMPLRQGIFSGNKKEAASYFGLDLCKPVILIWGGSQGARKINETISQILPKLLQKKYQVIHITGQWQPKLVAMGSCYFLFKNLEGKLLANAIAAADLIVSRVGAGSLFELAALAKPAILIPYPFAAQNHQVKNAKIFEKADAAKIIFENETNFPQNLFNKINEILENPKQKERLSENILKLYKDLSSGAAEKIASEILEAN
jgi:UDP-N-acetylglucosamine--N-acetylmuramyl-(pentapeptide) pyrophosphoryl-undecaprenol N-acetylglucosamine transferase